MNKVHIEYIFGLALVALIPILSTRFSLDPQMSIQFIALSTLLMGFSLFNGTTRNRIVFRNSFVRLFVLLFTFFIVYSSISALKTNNASDSIFFFARYILSFSIILAFLSWNKSNNLFKIISRSAVLLSSIIIVPAIFQIIVLMNEKNLIIPLRTYEVFSVFPHRNLFSEVLLLSLPFGIYAIFSEKGIWKYLSFFSFNLSLIMIIVLSNRASWLGLFLMSGCVAMVCFIRKRQFFRNKAFVAFIVNSLFVIAFSSYVLISYSEPGSLKKHSLNALDYTQGSTKDRIGLWSRTIKLIGEKPILGAGLACWKINMLKYGNEGLASEDNTTFYQRPHNDFLWVAAEQGIVGGIVYFLLFVFIGVSILKNIFNKADPIPIQQLLVILAVTMSFFTFSLFSFPKERISHNILLFTSWGLYLNLLNSKTDLPLKKIVRLKGFNFFSLIVFSLIVMLGTIRLRSEVLTKRAILSKKEARFKNCIVEIQKAKSVFYKMDETSTPLSWYSGLSHYKLHDYKNAISDFEKAYQINPYHIYVLNDYAGSLTKVDENVKAIELYVKAIHIAPNFLESKLNACALYYQEERYSEAFDLLKTTDVEETSERYMKTVSTVIKKIINNQLVTTSANGNFIQLYQKEYKNYFFYKQFLLNAITHDLAWNDLNKHIELLHLKPLNNEL